MKKKLYIIIGILLLASCAGKAKNPPELQSLKYSFKEVYISHHTKTGETTLRFYGMNEMVLEDILSSSDFTHILNLSRFTLEHQYKMTIQGSPALEVQLKAKNILQHKENISQLYSRIWGLHTEVQDLKVDPMGIYLIGIIMEHDPSIYGADTNAQDILINLEESLMMFQFNIFDDPIEIVMGYRD